MRLMGLMELMALMACGCAYNSAKLYDPATGHIVAKSRTYTWFDSKSELARLHIDSMAVTNHHGTFSPGISISGLSQESTSTNLNELAGRMMEGAVSGILKATGKP